MDVSLIIPAFIAGILTFLAPCTLPLLPGYLSFISGVSLDELYDPARAGRGKRTIFLNGVLFVVGFSLVFIILGTLVGFIGSALAPYRLWLSRIGGIFVIFFGLFMLDIFGSAFLSRDRRISAPLVFKRGRPVSAFIFGATFAFGWTPCVGPILGSILLLASTTTTVWQGGILLGVFSAGLAVPFLLVAALISRASEYLSGMSPYLSAVSKVGGIFLVFLGILLVTGNMGLLVSYSYRLFQFINYERLLDYL